MYFTITNYKEEEITNQVKTQKKYANFDGLEFPNNK